MLSAVITLSTASVYYAQQVQDTADTKSQDIEQVILHGVTDIAKDRKTPVAVSTVKAAQIVERQGNQELVEVLNTTPSVYASKGGGGFGDSQIVIRGFESRNVAVMVNGMPVNDMEGGTVYMSNWTGLSDVTSFMQVQRGLGSSKLAIASVGGTMNFITRSADMKQGGIVRLGVGNNDYLKSSFAYNTGLSKNGWSTSILMSRQAGSTYIENTDYEAYTYFLALGYKPNEKHNLQFMVTNSPQWHNQRSYAPTISNYIKFNPDHDGTPYRRYNSDFGYYTTPDGRKVAIANKANYYSKPVMMLNWDWKMDEKSTLSTVLYMSNGRGGGTGNLGSVAGKGATQFNDENGHINFNPIFEGNQAVDPNTGSTLIRSSSINSHNWYGILANFQHKINDNWNYSLGTDDRYYYGYHYQVVSDLYGASGYKDDKNQNVPAHVVSNIYDYQKMSWSPFGGSLAPMEDRIGYSNDGEVLWYSGFGQLEYNKNGFSAFVQGAISNQGYQRIDNFVIDGVSRWPNNSTGQILNKKTGFKNLVGYDVKAGANYNINEHHGVFANVGYYSKQPFMNTVYPGNQNLLNPTLTNEKILGTEAGYNFRSAKFNANVNLYRMEWKDRYSRLGGYTYTDAAGVVHNDGYTQVNGIQEIHMGVELDANYRPFDFLQFDGMLSLGDYTYGSNAQATNYDNLGNPLGEGGTLYLDGLKVGGSGSNSIPQTTASLGATVKPVKDLSVYGTWRYVGNIYPTLYADSFKTQELHDKGVIQLPDFNLFDLGASFKIRLKNTNQYFTVGANVYNLFDTTYIADAATNLHPNDVPYNLADGTPNTKQLTYEQLGYMYKGIADGNRVYFGFGRTWATTLSFNF